MRGRDGMLLLGLVHALQGGGLECPLSPALLTSFPVDPSAVATDIGTSRVSGMWPLSSSCDRKPVPVPCGFYGCSSCLPGRQAQENSVTPFIKVTSAITLSLIGCSVHLLFPKNQALDNVASYLWLIGFDQSTVCLFVCFFISFFRIVSCYVA